MRTRFPATTIDCGPFTAKVDFDPQTGAPHAVFIMGRGKIGHDLDSFLYDLSTKISRVMQGKP